MPFKKKPNTALSLAIVLAAPTVVAAEGGFLEDASFKVLNRNFYYSHDYRSGDSGSDPQTGERRSRHAEWAHGIMANFESGFTQGVVGFGVDAHAYAMFNLGDDDDLIGNGVSRPGLVARYNDGDPKDRYGKAGGALKLRAFGTELHYGDVRPTSPVLTASDIRLLPQTLRGFMFRSNAIEGLSLQGGKLDSSSDRTASSHGGDLGTAYGGRFKDADDVIYLGGDYKYKDALTLKLHTSQLDEIWRQSFASADWIWPLAEGLNFNAGFNYYRTRDTGKALLGEIDNDSWSTHVGLGAGAQKFTLAYTRIDGDTPFDYVWNTYNLQLDSASQVSDFNNPNERIWTARYDLDFAAFGIPGLTLTARYVRGSDIDGTNAGPGYAGYTGISDGKHWERDLWLGYVVQSGPAKGLTFKALQGTHRVGGDHTAENNVDQLRLIVEYPLDLRQL